MPKTVLSGGAEPRRLLITLPKLRWSVSAEAASESGAASLLSWRALAIEPGYAASLGVGAIGAGAR